MEGRTRADDGSEVRFNHGLVDEDDNPDLTVSIRALRVAEAFSDDDRLAERFADVRQKLVEAGQYTEGHHAVAVTVDRTVLNRAHRQAVGVLSDDSVAESVADNWHDI